ncbi:SAVED domain-containing protein [Roseibium aggregatum]|uniref:SAVED domain-containing protein n=1 Tax=Roseibium aggregatum TaxID=187304 RepID=UPI001A8FD99B|nr:SAVED domain-containing protein [Roseibium aggregatum]MBN8183117.1 SAVED domain-containing protein [Roseibium aggregatum]
MADSVVANWDGHDYQARVFWLRATELRRKDRAYVVEVSYEADGPKGFDDVVVRYSPARKGRRIFEIQSEHFQIKFHVNEGGRFGYADLIEPEFIGAKKVSILQRLRDAVRSSPAGSTFWLVTIDRIRDDDPLRELLSGRDSSFEVDKLRVGKTDNSKMGAIRKLWREHLELENDEELFSILDCFHIKHGAKNLEEMREEVDAAFYLVNLQGGENTWEFNLDGVIKGLKSVGKNKFTRDEFEAFVKERDWIRTDDDDRHPVSVRSFGDASGGYLATPSDSDLSLLDKFEARHLKAGSDWTSEIQPEVEDFLIKISKEHKRIRLSLEAHASIAFLAGSVLHSKSGINVEMLQKGRLPTTIWRSDDMSTGPRLAMTDQIIGQGQDVAVVVSLARNASRDVTDFVQRNSPQIGRILHFVPPDGHRQSSVAGGTHAANLADQVTDAVSELGLRSPARVHIFVAGPNAFSFFLGQHREALGKVVLYEFDFGGTREYHPSFEIG